MGAGGWKAGKADVGRLHSRVPSLALGKWLDFFHISAPPFLHLVSYSRPTTTQGVADAWHNDSVWKKEGWAPVASASFGTWAWYLFSVQGPHLRTFSALTVYVEEFAKAPSKNKVKLRPSVAKNFFQKRIHLISWVENKSTKSSLEN